MSDSTLLSVRDVTLDYRLKRKKTFRALKGVDLDIAPGECVGLVGESGSGKSTLGKAILGLESPSGGSITFDGRDITHASRSERRALASDIQVVFQDPYGSLDPGMTVGASLAEPLLVAGVSRKEAAARVADMLDDVLLPRDSAARLPHEFSGGQRQRLAIARALIRRPRLVICDEPVSALDLTTQATVLDLFIELQRRTGVSYLFITHDLGVVRKVSHRIAVMYHGDIAETGEGERITSEPQVPYTQRLLAAAPVADPVRQAQRREHWLSLRSEAPEESAA